MNEHDSSAASPWRHAPLFATVLTLFVGGSLTGIFRGLPRDDAGFGILVAAGISLALYTFLYADNPIFKAAEHLYVGVGLGYQVVTVWFEYIKPEAYKQLLKYAVREGVPGRPEWALVPALVLSGMLLLRFIPSLAWLSRIPVAFIVGFTAGAQIPNFVSANILKQVEQTIVPLPPHAPDGSIAFLALLGNLVVLAGVITTLLYFFFSVEHRGAIGVGSRIGVWFLMVAFGASFGYTVMGRMALIVGQIRFLIEKWLQVPLQ
jgi:hypothetical protein